jgi:hypothetical protein
MEITESHSKTIGWNGFRLASLAETIIILSETVGCESMEPFARLRSEQKAAGHFFDSVSASY